jgi:hypothetical protein
MPRTVRPFGDRARPDPGGNVVPYDTPSGRELLEATGNGQQDAWPCELVGPVGIEMVPFQAMGFRAVTAEGLAVPREPEMVLGANDRRGAVTLWTTSNVPGGLWRVAGSKDDAARDETSLIVGSAVLFALTPAIRLSWSGQLWVQERPVSPAGFQLFIQSEDWAR